MHAQRPRADVVRSGALGSSWPLRLRGAPARLSAQAASRTKMQQHQEEQAERPRRPSSPLRSQRRTRCRALPADAEGAPQLEAYTTDRTPDSEPKLVEAADVDSHRSLR